MRDMCFSAPGVSKLECMAYHLSSDAGRGVMDQFLPSSQLFEFVSLSTHQTRDSHKRHLAHENLEEIFTSRIV